MHFLDMLPGIIWSCFLGLAIGNFATNPIYRLPRKEPLFVKDPYCGDCNALLKPRDLFPVFSWLMTRGKCRYCGAAVPAAYAFTEGLVGALFVACYLRFGFNEEFILVSLGLTSFVMLAMMLYLDNFFSDRTLIACLVLGMLYRVLGEGTLYGFAGTGYAALIVSLLVWKYSGRPMVRDVAAFPDYLKLLTVSGVWLHASQLVTLLVITAAASVIRARKELLVELVIIEAAIIIVLLT